MPSVDADVFMMLRDVFLVGRCLPPGGVSVLAALPGDDIAETVQNMDCVLSII